VAVASVLRESTLRTWRNIVALALDEEVDFVLVAGDVFEQANRTLRGQVRFLDGLTELSAAGISSFVITGNHDPLSGREPSLTWPALAYRFPAHRVTSKPMLKNGEEIARIYGVSYHVRDVQTNLAVGFHREEGSPFAIGLLHANVGGLDGAANYAPCTLTDLRASGMDYWALGHVHRNRVLADGQPTVVYCGSPQGCDPTETHAGGVYIVTVEDGEIRPHFRPVDCVRWRRLDVNISGLANE
jgi:DNA repair exonuclease SbcCD nuclease subunit